MTLTDNDKISPYGEYDGLRSVNQMTFEYQSTCWLASSLNIALNTYSKIPYNKDEFENFVQNEYTNTLGNRIPLGRGGAPGIAGAKRVKQYFNKKYGAFFSIRKFETFSEQFYKYLDKGYLCAVAININDDVVSGLLNQLIDKPTSKPFNSGHWVVVGKDSKGYFILNSRYPKTNKVRISNLKLEGVIKGHTESFTFIPTNKGKKLI